MTLPSKELLNTLFLYINAENPVISKDKIMFHLAGIETTINIFQFAFIIKEKMTSLGIILKSYSYPDTAFCKIENGCYVELLEGSCEVDAIIKAGNYICKNLKI